jgi:hypothetical protein
VRWSKSEVCSILKFYDLSVKTANVIPAGKQLISICFLKKANPKILMSKSDMIIDVCMRKKWFFIIPIMYYANIISGFDIYCPISNKCPRHRMDNGSDLGLFFKGFFEKETEYVNGLIQVRFSGFVVEQYLNNSNKNVCDLLFLLFYFYDF